MTKTVEIKYLGNVYYLLDDRTISGSMDVPGAVALRITVARLREEYGPSSGGNFSEFAELQIPARLRTAKTKLLVKPRKHDPWTVF